MQGVKGLLFINFIVVVEGTEDNLVFIGELLDLIVGPELVAFFKRIGYSWKKYEDFHDQTKVIFEEGLICW